MYTSDMTNPISNALLTSDFDDGKDEFILPVKNAPQPVEEASGSIENEKLTQPQDAVDQALHVPPQLVEDVQDNVEMIRPVARGMAIMNLHNLYTRIQHPATTNRDRLEFQALLNKMSGLEAKEAQQNSNGSGFSITINIPQVGASKPAVIEATGGRTDVSDAEVVEG